MYEELMPYWIDLCRRIKAGEVNPVTGLAPDDPFVVKVWKEKGYNWQWVGKAGKRGVLVRRIMLFTWKAGIEP